jgi:hypothetical protein
MMKRFEKLGTVVAFAVIAALLVLGQNPAPLGNYGNLGFVTTTISTATATLTANQMLGVTVGSNAGAVTFTTDSAVNICSMFPFVGASSSQGFAYDWYVKSTGAGGMTAPTMGAGVTLVGTGTAATLTVRHFKVILDACPVPGTTTPTAAVRLFSLETTAF